MQCSCAVTKAGPFSFSLSQAINILPNIISFNSFSVLFLLMFGIDRSSLHTDNDKTTYGAFLDVDPVNEKLSLRSLVS